VDDYPSDEELKAIAAARILSRADCKVQLDRVVELWVDYGHAIEDEGTYTFTTGGWSGNEDLIEAVRANFILHSLCWEQSVRGGKHIYKLPETP
jgi:hypothetical protein